MNYAIKCHPLFALGLPALAMLGILLPWQTPTKSHSQKITLATGKRITIPSRTVSFPGRSLDMVLDHNRNYVYVKTDFGIESINILNQKKHAYQLKGGTSQYGIALSPSGKTLACSNADSSIAIYAVTEGKLTLKETIAVPGKYIKGSSYPCGVAFSGDGQTLYACMSRDNCVAIIDLKSHSISRIPTDPAPENITILPDGNHAVVSCLSLSSYKKDLFENSSGTNVLVDKRGIAVHGAVCLVNLRTLTRVASAEVGLLPGKPLVIGSRAYVANANSDDVSVLALPSLKVIKKFRVARKNEFGASPNSITESSNRKLAIACGGENQIRFFDLNGTPQGSIGTPDYPIAIQSFGNQFVVACAKGLGNSTQSPSHNGGYSVFDSLATVSVVRYPSVLDGKISGARLAPATVTTHWIPSAIKHVIYIIKENRTYDQVFGDMADGDPSLLNFGEKVTPNEHALARQFGLLTRYFCDSIISTDGHAWSTEANSNAYLERSFGGWTRSYPWGDDPLAISKSGAIWDDALIHHKTVRNYGEYVYGNLPTSESFLDAFHQWKNHLPLPWKPAIEEKRLWSVSDHKFPGWGLRIPDQYRADEFILDYKARIQKGITPPDLTILYLEQDHTAGQAPGMPTPQAMNADNDYAVGRVIDAVSHSKYWKSTVFFVIEDDPQDGYDHIDGHRSLCLVVSPYSDGKGVNRNYYDQASVLHTIESILHIPPMSRFDRNAPIMYSCFNSHPNLKAFNAIAPLISLTTINGEGHKALLFAYPDESNDKALNLQIWDSIYPNRPYPTLLHSRERKN